MADSPLPQPADPSEALERLGSLSLRELSMHSLLQTVADLASPIGFLSVEEGPSSTAVDRQPAALRARTTQRPDGWRLETHRAEPGRTSVGEEFR